MKLFLSFLSFFRHFIPTMILVICVGIYMLFKPSEAPVPSTSTNSFTGSSSYEIPTPPPGQVSESMTNVPDFLPSPPIFQVPNDADITPQLPNKSFERSLSSSKSIKSQPPTHFAYLENKQNLVEVGSYYNRTAYLTLEAATAFKKMKLAATEVGIKLTPISGFRSFVEQEKLFQKQVERRGSAQAAQLLSAPPGFSEHHTGYALDIGDDRHPETDLKFAFDSTEAYGWLKVNASRYGFELSFPKNNLQGVSYEPWHWRFFGSPKAKEIFKQARIQEISGS